MHFACKRLVSQGLGNHSAFASGYRTDIDGLRAIAVVAVILFHARFWPFSGGFVGVDVFFVISGFLITSIIKKEFDRREFSIAKFYERRIRRIFPALFFLLLAVTPAALFVLLPVETLRYGKTLLATALFGANVYFWRDSGYFSTAQERNPLLHTWSLAVEEQFYVFFPLFLWLLLRLARPRLATLGLAAAALASLALAQWQLHVRPEAVFYLLPTRAWELLLGAVLAAEALPRPGRAAALGAGALGLAAIAASVVLYSPHIAFPGIAAALPCAGAALLLYAGARSDGAIARLLATPPMSFAGKISYSLYLWHLPPLVLARIHLGRELHVGESLALIAAAFGMSVLSYNYVETPFRRLGSVDLRWRAIGVGVAASALFSLLGLGLIGTDGLAARFPSVVVATDAAQEGTKYPPSCIGPNADRGGDFCRTRQFDVLVWGDSHAAAYFRGLERRAASFGLVAQLQWAGGCPPVLDAVPVTVAARRNETLPIPPLLQNDCAELNRDVLDLVRDLRVKAVALAGAWDFWTEGVDIGTGERRYLRDAHAEGNAEDNVEETRRVLRAGLERTISELDKLGIPVMLLEQVPDYLESPSECVARAYLEGLDPASCGRLTVDVRARSKASQRLLGEIGTEYGTRVIDPLPTFCPGERCLVEVDGTALYRDSDHLAPQGSIFIGDKIGAKFFGNLRTSSR
jgi:peptidoglycan/LPS O-acetylase OafA/YrhL